MTLRYIFSRLYSTTTHSLALQEQTKKRARRLIKTEDLFKRQQQINSSAYAVCTAESYDLVAMAQRMKGLSSGIQNRDVLHFRDESSSSSSSGVDCFFFRHGTFVVWKGSDAEAGIVDRFRDFARPFEKTSFPVEKQETEEIPFKVEQVEKTRITGEGESIVLAEEDDILSKLALSNGLADSVKIASLENFIDGHIEKVKDIPPILESGRRLPISRAQALRLTGQLLHFRAMLNLNSDLLDTPDMYWTEPHLEELYTRVARVLDNRPRIAVLNKKLDYASELADVLGSHLSEQHTWKLEWGIIALITVEVASDVLHWVLR